MHERHRINQLAEALLLAEKMRHPTCHEGKKHCEFCRSIHAQEVALPDEHFDVVSRIVRKRQKSRYAFA